MTVVTITDDNFEEEVSSSEMPVLVDYWATWCGPCKLVGPLVEEIATEFEAVSYTHLTLPTILRV